MERNLYQAIIRCLPGTDLECMNAWRSEDVLVAMHEDQLWARFSAQNSSLMQRAKSLPAERFQLKGSWLLREGHLIAEETLPDLNWQPISIAIELRLPWIGQSGAAANLETLKWQLSRGGQECPVAGSLVPWNELVAWIELAPQWRLERLRYCVSQYGLSPASDRPAALVLGTPVPPLNAVYLVARENILIPAGMQWLPAMEPACVQRSFGLHAGQWLLWLDTDDWYTIDDSLFAPLTRASARSFANAIGNTLGNTLGDKEA